ncbi:thiol-disulfide isomerase/thioredoxin [Nocardioides albertanoniae]|uniref:Thiol-disulfide isomerase/thioredoxin n=1 Tax=Nocardioides albertanoniae TaxID=1175486 RepID=A0A543A3R1_9ACTN|nr:thiol-disulfide isomerase/thioredoxin [Nocardioides albertanoniae]
MVAVALVVAFGAVIGAAMFLRDGPGQSSAASPGGDSVEEYRAGDRRPVGSIRGGLLDGGTFSSAEVSGVVVYNVWGSWCAPCRTEAPVLRRLSTEFATSGVRFIGINVRDNDQAARAFERTYDIAYPSITTASAPDALLAFGSAFPPRAVPSTFVVDAEGRLAARILGPAKYSTLKALVTRTLEASGPTS